MRIFCDVKKKQPYFKLIQLIIQNKVHEKIMNNLKVASYVTTTTNLFADEIRKYNKNFLKNWLIITNLKNSKNMFYFWENKNWNQPFLDKFLWQIKISICP